MPTLSPAAEKLLSSFPPEYRDRALSAIAEGKAFCPACAWAGMMNCAHFDTCGGGIDPNGKTFDENDVR